MTVLVQKWQLHKLHVSDFLSEDLFASSGPEGDTCIELAELALWVGTYSHIALTRTLTHVGGI